MPFFLGLALGDIASILLWLAIDGWQGRSGTHIDAKLNEHKLHDMNNIINLKKSPHAQTRPATIAAFELADAFWEPRRRINREETLAFQFGKLEESGCLDNFRRAAGAKTGDFRGPVFMDSDAYKWLEAAATSMGAHPTPALQKMVDEVAALIEGAQQNDGYLDTAFMFDKADKRWTNLRDAHEMYCAGHLIQAAIAHYRATDSTRLLDVARRVADHICAVFGPSENQKLGTGGHPEIEMALVELMRATSDQRYLQQAEFQVEMRGRKPSVSFKVGEPLDGDAYRQDHVPYKKLKDVTGHAVRMLYLAAGATDIALENGDEDLKAALDAQWNNFTTKRLYISGGAGARYEGEAFGADYELPNARAYTETCAAIASAMWNLRLLSLQPEARYADLLERTLYNAVLPGLSLDGKEYFYENPLENDGTHRRSAWFGCACCPPNVARLLAQLPGYFLATDDRNVWIYLYAQGRANVELGDGQSIEFEIKTRYPWDGAIQIEMQSAGNFGLQLRVPTWCADAQIQVNGAALEGAINAGSFVEAHRDWQVGDIIELNLPMPVRRVYCHPNVAENGGRVALMRGPLLYCVEATDIPNVDLHDLILPAAAELNAQFEPNLLGGVAVIKGRAQVNTPDDDTQLYRTALPTNELGREIAFAAIPYYAWANREAGQMRVWIREK